MGAKKSKQSAATLSGNATIQTKVAENDARILHAFIGALEERRSRGLDWSVYYAPTKQGHPVDQMGLVLRHNDDDIYSPIVYDTYWPLDATQLQEEGRPKLGACTLSVKNGVISIKGSLVQLESKTLGLLQLKPIDGDEQYAYEGILDWSPEHNYTVYLLHEKTVNDHMLKYSRLRRSDSSITTTSAVFWKHGEEPAKFLRWETPGHVSVTTKGGNEVMCFVKDCRLVTDASYQPPCAIKDDK